MATVRDQNGTKLTKSIRREDDGTFGRNVWFGGLNGLATNARRYHYNSRKNAERGDISDEIGKCGRVR